MTIESNMKKNHRSMFIVLKFIAIDQKPFIRRQHTVNVKIIQFWQRKIAEELPVLIQNPKISLFRGFSRLSII